MLLLLFAECKKFNYNLIMLMKLCWKTFFYCHDPRAEVSRLFATESFWNRK